MTDAPSGLNETLNATGESRPSGPGAGDELAVTCAIGALLSAMCAVGLAGNAYTLLVVCRPLRVAASMYSYIISLALADLLCLATVPFVVATYFAQEWLFGELGCRLLFCLDFLTMHASIFTLTAMSTERYLAVLRPLDTLRRSKGYRKAAAGAIWLLALLLSLPMLLVVRLEPGGPKRLCLPSWGWASHGAYLVLLFGSSIVGPGLVIGYLYGRLVSTYWRGPGGSGRQRRRRPERQKVLCLILAIVLAFWACFVPFWTWQLVLHFCRPLPLGPRAARSVNYLTTCLTYGNSCVNPFLYTLLTHNYRRSQQGRPRAPASWGPRPARRGPSGASLATSSQLGTETLALARVAGSAGWA
ncbi:urotensin-2 receptor [Tachyglossus aculeatus]|uniref:urotensin-2 receptor n=1 Tax=Tachyglossus aculeatus TaxID=9261 RepID=UPI0018F3CF7D|nr:urotensin-2 receptor [Tachyglossus aculeatus]